MNELLHNPYGTYSEAEEKHMQTVYLRFEKGLSYSDISKYVGYAVSTVSAYCKQYYHLLEKAKKFFTEFKKIFPKNRIDWNGKEVRKGECFYTVEFFDKEGNFLFNKIGTSNDVARRMTEELREYKNLNVYSSKMTTIFYCDSQALTLALESFFRYHFIIKWKGEGYIKNDRFLFHFDYNFINTELETFKKENFMAL